MKMTDDQLNDWNETHPPGTPCILNDINNRIQILTRTRSIAWRLGHGEVVVLVEGKEGGWSIDHLLMVTTIKQRGMR